MLRTIRLSFACLFLTLLCLAGPAGAQPAPETFAVLPFELHGPEKYTYLEQGIQSMLVSRLTWQDHYHPLDKSLITATSSQVDSTPRAAQVLDELGADYLIWGSVTMLGEECSLDVNVLDAAGQASPYPVQTTLSQLIPALETVAKDINTQVFEKVEPVQAAQTGEPGPRPINPDLVYNETGTQDYYLNPEFSYAGSTDEQARWRSQSLPYAAIGAVVGDADGDGTNEVIVLDDHRILAYQMDQNRLRLLTEHELSPRIQCLNINLLDMNKDGLQEIIVSGSYDDESASSYILNYKNNAFTVVKDRIDLFLNVVRTPPDYLPVLVGQRMKQPQLFFGDVGEVMRSGDEYTLGRSLNLPDAANVFNFAYLPFEDDYKILVVGRKNNLMVYSSTGHRQAITEEMYAGSSTGIVNPDVLPGLSQRRPSEEDPDFYYLPTRLVPVNLDRDNRFELLVNKNISVSAQFFSRYRYFPQGEIHNLYWDGIGLNINWKTRRIKGSIVDYGIEDIDNNGKLELYVCLNTHPGITGLSRQQTFLLAYSLDIDETNVGAIIRPVQQ